MPAFFHIHSAIREKSDALIFQKHTAEVCMIAAGYRSVILNNALPLNIIRATTHRPANLTRRTR